MRMRSRLRRQREPFAGRSKRRCRHCAHSARTPRIIEAFLQQLIAARRRTACGGNPQPSHRTVGLGQLRRAVLAASGWLQSEGVLSDADDVFCLTFSEILAGLRKSGEGPPEEIIRARQEEYHAWEQYQPPPHLGLPSAVLPPRPPDTDALTPDVDQIAGQIRGIGASAGVVSGPAGSLTSGRRFRVLNRVRSWSLKTQGRSGCLFPNPGRYRTGKWRYLGNMAPRLPANTVFQR